MSTPVETNTAAPVIEVPSKDETPAVINVDDHAVNTETTTAPVTAREPTAAATKVTPAQRLNSVFTKARQTVTDAVSDAQKAINERKANNPATTTTTTTTTTTAAAPTDTTTTEAVVNSAPEPTDKKVGGPNNTFKGILNRVKGLKPATTHPTVAGAPVPPPKDNIKAAETNPVLEQFKRNTTLLSNYLLQKKKEFTEKKSSDINQQQTTTPELHSETEDKPTTNGSPLVRRITQLVHSATASINKKKKTEADNADIVPPTVVNASSAAVTSAA
ncbi:hypothetical protein INT48_005846 [Thamnidium elegans]|uniref:Uncharacterized protein n=1 Tax=Thamnidium elegans TaxID=101142 RepID=A0A8H7SPT9_9FUNG|nr:hypothetical protein INT48_005846 [Thamnidium elegans]